MGNQADGGKFRIAGNSAVDIAMLIHKGIGNAQALHLLHKISAQQLLLGSRGAGCGLLTGLRVKRYVFQETFGYIHKQNLSQSNYQEFIQEYSKD